ncbi:hypothetical protein Aduo_018953 [Ancylostoma duodenale]
MSYEDEIDLGFHVATVEGDEVRKTLSELCIHYDEISCDDDCVFLWYFRGLLVKHHPECIFDLATTACLWCVRREEVKALICGDDDHLHEAVIEALHLGYRVTEALRGDDAHTVPGLRTAVVDYFEAVAYLL